MKEIDFERDAPGPRSDPEEGKRAFAEAEDLRETLWPMNVPLAAKYIRQNPPSPEAIALLGLAWYEHIIMPGRREGGRKGAETKKRDAAPEQKRVFHLLEQGYTLGQIHENIDYSPGHLRKLRKKWKKETRQY